MSRTPQPSEHIDCHWLINFLSFGMTPKKLFFPAFIVFDSSYDLTKQRVLIRPSLRPELSVKEGGIGVRFINRQQLL
jgi:hypothetical protein